jgi:hypothetical protein
MDYRKFLRRINTAFLASLSFLLVFIGSTAYAQQNQTVASTDQGNYSFLWFSLVLIVVMPALVVFVLWMNRKTSQSTVTDKHVQFETERLYFAAVVLTGLAIVFLESMAMYYWSPAGSAVGKEIFDTCKTVIPSIVTLVIGYYFGRTEQRQESERNRQRNEEEES